MKYIITISLLLIYSTLFAQDEKSLKSAAGAFHNALLAKDSAQLKSLLHEKLVYGHSNGWIETKRELIEDLYNGKITYTKIQSSEEQVTIEGSTACIRATLEIEATMDGKTLPFKLHGLQVWIWKNKKWQMMSRQSVKI